MKYLTLSALFALASALPVVAQSNGEALPPPNVSPHAKRVFDGSQAPPGKKPGRLTRRANRTVSGTIRGEGTSGQLTIELTGEKGGSMPLSGRLTELLRSRAMGRTLSLRVAVRKSKDGSPPAFLVIAAQGTARHDQPIFQLRDADRELYAPGATLTEGSTCWVYSGESFALVTSAAGKGRVRLSGIEFGVLAEDPTENQDLAEQRTQETEAGSSGSSGGGGIVGSLGTEPDEPAEHEERQGSPR